VLLRRWRSSDLAPFARLSADPVVMEHFPGTLTRAQSAALIEREESSFDAHGYGLWALEIPGEIQLGGFVGLTDVDRRLPFAPAVEVGWRLAHELWGRGLASEGARMALAYAFGELRLDEVVSTTAARNRRSRAVMERIGMQRDEGGDFLHPALPRGHALEPHVLYRLRRG
jgi:ribosomal-protein-alanine N-acetyltransferase